MDIYTESSGIDTSPDMNSSAEMLSPERLLKLNHISQTVQPRKLTFGSSPEENRNFAITASNDCGTNNQNNCSISPIKHPSISPPYRKVRALRLFDTPATPKTILKKSSGAKTISTDYKNTNKIENNIFCSNLVNNSIPLETYIERPRSIPLHNRILDSALNKSAANINPFSPNNLFIRNKKRLRPTIGQENCHNNSLPILFNNNDENHSDEETYEIKQAPKRLALQDSNISRYQKEFVELSLIGVGEFGLVYQCLNKLDGCIYAIKKSIKPVAGSSFEKIALNEVWAHAVLGKHDNVVRYYSAWAEDNHMLIQNEYCNGGCLAAVLRKRSLVESELRILLMHIAQGLMYIHSNDLVHLDLKAGNIFLTKAPIRASTSRISSLDSYDDGFEEIYDELENAEYLITYKIGDLGHVTSVKHPQVEEGDCRYLPNEILQDDYRYLFKADIFSLGITLYEAGGGGPLPKNGPEWHKLRQGEVPDLPNLSKEFNDLIKLMLHSDPEKRPSSSAILNHPVLNGNEFKTKAELNHELAVERQKNELLIRKLKETKKLLKSYEQSITPVNNKKYKRQSPIISDRRLRSYTRRGKPQNTLFTINYKKSIKDKNKNVIDEDF